MRRAAGLATASVLAIFAAAFVLVGALALAWAPRVGAASDGWSQEAISAPSGGAWIHLRDVSCTSTGACIVVGFYSDSSSKVVPLAESWNGSSWSAQTVPVPSGAKRSQLEGVSCSSQSACVAVGYYLNSASEEVPLAESWNGSSWSAQTYGAEPRRETKPARRRLSAAERLHRGRRVPSLTLPKKCRWRSSGTARAGRSRACPSRFVS